MNKNPKRAGLARLAGLLLAVVAGDACAQSNLLANPEFNANLSGWTVLQSRPAVWSSRDATASVYSGSARITNVGTSNGGIPLTLRQCVPATGGSEYRIGGLGLVPSGQPANTSAQIFVYSYASSDCSGSTLDTSNLGTAAIESWGQMQATLVAASGAHSLSFSIGVYKPNGVSTDAAANFDNLYLWTTAAVARGHAIDGTLSGSWYNTATPGQGVFFDVSPSIGLFFAGWYTWTGVPGQYDWITAQGGYTGDTAMVPIYRTRGGMFNNPAPVATAPAGWAEFRFADCTHAQATFLFTGGGPSGTFALQRLTPPLAGCVD